MKTDYRLGVFSADFETRKGNPAIWYAVNEVSVGLQLGFQSFVLPDQCVFMYGYIMYVARVYSTVDVC